jgi:hypothetical protein
MEGSGFGSEYGSESVPLANVSGPGRPKTYGSYLQSLGAIRYIAIPHTVAVEEEIQSKNIEINSDRGSEHERKIYY